MNRRAAGSISCRPRPTRQTKSVTYLLLNSCYVVVDRQFYALYFCLKSLYWTLRFCCLASAYNCCVLSVFSSNPRLTLHPAYDGKMDSRAALSAS